MSEPLEAIEIARQWVEKAEHDLLNITQVLTWILFNRKAQPAFVL
jgi:hypothetical protein